MVKHESEEVSTVSAIAELVKNGATPVILNITMFVAGVAFIKSPLMDNLAPQ
jgi:hypothetical protein